MERFEYGAVSSKYELTANNKYTAYCAMCYHFNRSAHLIAIYYPEESKEDSWLNPFGQISDRLDEVFKEVGDFDTYLKENIDEVTKAYNTIKQLV